MRFSGTIMRKPIILIAILTAFFMPAPSVANDSNIETFSSDSVGMKVDYPSNWNVQEYRWGFVLTEPETNASVNFQAFFMPKELEEKYDINMNEEYEKIYLGRFESRDKGEIEISGLTWDYTVAKGGINSDIEYIDIACSILLENTVYLIQVFYNTNVDDEIKKTTEEIVDSVRLMYRTVDLPMIRRYRNEWLETKDSQSSLSLTAPGRLFEIDYEPPWIFLGGGSNTEASFYYIAKDPFIDIGMFFVEFPMDDAYEVLNIIQDISAQYTIDYIHVHESVVFFNEYEFIKREMRQGLDENLQHTRMFATEHNGRTLIAVFTYLKEDETINQDKVIDEFMENLKLL